MRTGLSNFTTGKGERLARCELRVRTGSYVKCGKKYRYKVLGCVAECDRLIHVVVELWVNVVSLRHNVDILTLVRPFN
jgi:hypothetical protein